MKITRKQANSTAERLRSQGHRLTKLRVALLALFEQKSKPVSVKQILSVLAKQDLMVNKTSVYRELEFLQNQGVVKPVLIGGAQALYEGAQDHHHHLVCRSCDTVEDIHVPALEKTVDRLQSQLTKSTGFAEIEHSMEFFGLCHECR